MRHSPWQLERTKILQRICARVHAREQAGQSRASAIALFSKRWNQRPYKCDPARRLGLNESTLFRLYKVWRMRGQTPQAFQLNYRPTRRRIAAPVLIRFVRFIAERDWESFRAAWEAFCLRGANFGPGRIKLGYDALLWNLPKNCFREFKRVRLAKLRAESELAQLKQRFNGEILARVPGKLPRRGDFEI